MIIDACKLCEDWITLMVEILLVKLVLVTFIISVLFCFIFFSFWVFLLFVFVCSFTSSVSLSTCTNKLPLTFYLQIHDELKLTSPCRIVAPSSKGLQRLFSICCHTHLICLLSGLPIFTKVPPSLATPVQRSTYQVVCQAEGFPRPVIN